MKEKIILISFVLLALSKINAQHSHLTSGKTYYISFSEGNDSNNGLSPSQAWKTTNNITYYGNADVSLPNTKILFKKGDIWNDTGFILKNLHGTVANPITIGSYGTGKKPIISGKSIIDAQFKKLYDNSLNQIQNLWYCNIESDPGRIFHNNNELMKGYDVRFHNTWVYNATQTDRVKSYNQNKYDLGQYQYSLIDDCNSPIKQNSFSVIVDLTLKSEKVRWFWIAEPTIFWFNTLGNTESSVTINGNTLILYSETDPNNYTIYKSTNSGPSWKSFTNIQIVECSNILISDIDFQGGRDGIIIGSYSEAVLGNDDITSNIEIKNCNIGKFSHKPLEIRNAKNIKIHDNIFDSGYNKKIGLSETNCKATIYNLMEYPDDDNPGYWFSGSDRGTGDAIQLSYYAKNCEIYNNQIKNFSHSGVQLNTWRYAEPHIADSRWNVSENKIYNNQISSPDLSYGRAFGVFGNKSENNEFYNNLIKNVTIQSQIAGINNSFHHNIFENVTQSDIRPKGYAVGLRVIPTQPDIECTGNKFDNNTFINCEDAGIMITSESGYLRAEDNYFRNNVVYNSGSEEWGGIIIQSKAPNLDLEGDRVRNNKYSNNLVYNTNSNVPQVLYHGTAHTVNSFNSQNGNRENTISNNISQNPKFIDLTSSYNMLNNSPCRNNGDISIILDANGNILDNNEFNKFDYYNTVFPNEAPDIGAIEVNPVITRISNTDEECNKVLPLTNTRVDFYPIPNNNQGYTIKLTDSDFNYLEFFTTTTYFYLSDYYDTELRNSDGVLIGQFIEPNRWYDVKIKKGNFNHLYNYSNYGGSCNIKSPNFPLNKNMKDDFLYGNDLDQLFYPNPCHDILNIVSDDTKIQVKIFSIEGNELISKMISKNNNTINVSQLPNGVYILVIYRNEETTYEKFIKE